MMKDVLNEIYDGEYFADSLNTIILQIKFQTVGDKLKNYYEAFKPEIDIPEFMKPKNERIEEKIRQHLINLYYSGTLDYWYQRALED